MVRSLLPLNTTNGVTSHLKVCSAVNLFNVHALYQYSVFDWLPEYFSKIIDTSKEPQPRI